MTFARLLWCALVAVEVAAVGLAVAQILRASRPLEPLPSKTLQIVLRAVAQIWRALRALEPAGAFFALLAFALVDELAVEGLHVFVFAGAPRPLAGWARVGWHLETALVLGWPAMLAATCVRVFGAVGSCFGASNEVEKEEPRRRARLTERAENGLAVADNLASTKRRRSPILAGLYLGSLSARVAVADARAAVQSEVTARHPRVTASAGLVGCATCTRSIRLLRLPPIPSPETVASGAP